ACDDRRVLRPEPEHAAQRERRCDRVRIGIVLHEERAPPGPVECIAESLHATPIGETAQHDLDGVGQQLAFVNARDVGRDRRVGLATVTVDLQHRRHREDFAYRLCHATSTRRVGEVNHDNGFAPAQRFEGRRERRVAAQRARPRRYAAARALPDEDLPAGQRAAPELLQPLRAVGDEKDGDPRARWRSTFTSFGHVSSPPPHPPHQGPEAMMYFASYRAMASWITRMAASLFSHPTIWTRLPSRSL